MLGYARKEIFIMKEPRTREILDKNIELLEKNIEILEKKKRWKYKLY